MSEDSTSRAEKLAGRWSDGDDGEGDAAAAAASETADADRGGDATGHRAGGADTADTDTDADVDADTDASEDHEDLTTREKQAQMLYLEPEFHKELDLAFQQLDLRFRRDRDRNLQKNRDFYAGVLRLGLEQLGDPGDRDLDEIEELLDL